MVVTQLICPLLLCMLPTQGFQDTWFSLWFTDWSFLCFCSQSFVFFSSLTILLMVGLTKVIQFIWMAKEDVVCVCVCVYIYISCGIYICVYEIYTHTHTHMYIHTYTMEYYSPLKKNDIMPFAARCMQLEIIILSEVGQKRKINIIWYHLYVESKLWYKLIYEIESQA